MIDHHTQSTAYNVAANVGDSFVWYDHHVGMPRRQTERLFVAFTVHGANRLTNHHVEVPEFFIS